MRGERDALNDLQGHSAPAAVWERAGSHERRLYRTRRASTTTTTPRNLTALIRAVLSAQKFDAVIVFLLSAMKRYNI